MKYRKAALFLLILAFGLPVFMLPNKILSKGFLANIYNKTLGNEWYVDNLKIYVNKYLGGSLRLFTYYVFENSYYSDARETRLYVYAAMPKGATIVQLNGVFVEIENFLVQYGNQVQYYSRILSPQYAEMTIIFKDKSADNILPYILKSRLIARSLDFGGVNWDIYGYGKGFSNRTGVNEMINFKVALYGYNYDELEVQAKKLRAKLQKHPRVRNVNIAGNRQWWSQEKSYEYFIDLKTDKMDYWDISLADIYNEFNNRSLQNGGKQIGLFTGESYVFFNIVPENFKQLDKWQFLHQPLQDIPKFWQRSQRL